MRVRDLNWMQLEAYLREDDRIVLPVGSTEQHAYLSLETDNILAEQRLDDVRDDGDQRGLPERGAARVRGEAGHPVWQRRKHRDPERLGGLDRRTLGKDVVGLELEVRMLLR